MKQISAIAVVVSSILAGMTMSHAADVIIEEVAVAPAPNSSGWYIRGDIGYTFKSNTDGNWNFWNIKGEPYRGIDDTLKYDNFDLKGGASYGLGVGYRWNDMFRTDLTLDYFRAGIDGRTRCTSYVKSDNFGFNPVLDNCNYEDSSTADIWTVMANAYVDLPKIGNSLTPYIGAGIGAAYVNYGTWDTKEVCSGFPPNGNKCDYEAPKAGLDSWRFAMALMAGVSYDLSDQLKLDLGYRYTRVNGGRAYGYDEMDRKEFHENAGDFSGNGPGATGTQASDNGFNLHTVRAGLRYEFR